MPSETENMETDPQPYIPGPDDIDISPDNNGGIYKVIVKPGEGDETPKKGDRVYVHYTGKLLDGTKFDSSVDRGEEFEFTLGKGEVIKAWDIVVATMKKGEKCTLVCHPDFAYGKSGMKPKISGNATLVFDVELIRWQMEDLTTDKDGGVLRSIIEEGEGFLSPSEGATVEGNEAKCPNCKEPSDAKCVPSSELKCLDRPFRYPTCKDTVQLSIWFDDQCDMARVKATEKLGDIFKSGNHSDVIIKIKDEEFHLHKNILANRSPYFSAMFKADIKEKNTGIVNIDDCDVDVFRNYALFLYTGKVDEMTTENVCDLYEVADKYQEDQLRKECLCFMKTKMSVESFFDFIIVALKHDDNELLQNATDFYCRHTKEILQSVKWLTFLIEYTTQANELFLKAIISFNK